MTDASKIATSQMKQALVAGLKADPDVSPVLKNKYGNIRPDEVLNFVVFKETAFGTMQYGELFNVRPYIKEFRTTIFPANSKDVAAKLKNNLRSLAVLSGREAPAVSVNIRCETRWSIVLGGPVITISGGACPRDEEYIQVLKENLQDQQLVFIKED